MPVKKATVKIGDGDSKKTVTVNELTVKDILGIFEQFGEDAEQSDIFTQVATILPTVTDLSFDELQEFTPSDLKTLYDKFVEVNQVFFDIARKAGMTEILRELKEAVISDFQERYASSLSQGTQDALSTDTPSSSQQPKKAQS